MAKLETTVNVYSGARRITANGRYSGTSTSAHRETNKIARCITARAPTGGTIVGAASMYDPFQPGYDEGGIETASGELYDPIAWTGAIQIALRETFGGIRHGKDYRPAYALVEAAGKKAIIKINDVGPLKPGRVIDFNENTMRYFDPSLQRGIVHSVKITPLPGEDWAPGPVNR
jgi:rare lipoprotein A